MLSIVDERLSNPLQRSLHNTRHISGGQPLRTAAAAMATGVTCDT